MSVGQTSGADGTYAIGTPRIDKTASAIVQESGGRYGENALRGNMFCAQEVGAGIAPGTVIGTTAAFSLWNPTGNNKRFKVNRASVGYVSGTLGAGTMYLCGGSTAQAAAPTGGTAIVPKNMDIGNGSKSSAVCGVGTTLSASPTPMIPLSINGAFTAATAGNGQTGCSYDLEDAIVVEPGWTLAMEGVMAAGTTPLVSPGLVWTEELIV